MRADKTDKESGRQKGRRGDSEIGEKIGRRIGRQGDWGDAEIRLEVDLPGDVLRSRQEG